MTAQLIRNYGLYWHKDKVFWGKPKVPGSILGSASPGGRQKIEFREQTGIYALYADYELVYVGQMGAGVHTLMHRLRNHLKDHLAERWNRFSWFGTRYVKKDHTLAGNASTFQVGRIQLLNKLEAIVIATAEPKLNLQRGIWGNATQYFQVDANPKVYSIDDKINDLIEAVESINNRIE